MRLGFGDVADYERGGVDAAVAAVVGLTPSLRRVDGDRFIELRPRVERNTCQAIDWLLNRFSSLGDEVRYCCSQYHCVACVN